MNFNAVLPFYEHSLKTPDALALSVNDEDFTYSQLAARAQKISCWLSNSLKRKPVRVGILATRSVEACAAVIGVSWAGATYIPISLKLPKDRLCTVLAISELDALVTDTNGAALLSDEVLASCPEHILVPDGANLASPVSAKKVYLASSLPEEGYEHPPAFVNSEDLAYIIFTSGTTGVPKGVMIFAKSLRHFSSVMKEIYQFNSSDRISETADISFDLSVGNMFITWEAGASLHVVPVNKAMSPIKFIQDHSLTVWFSVPSVISFILSMKMLKPGIFPALRYSLFIGEPLPLNWALAWQEAAPNSIVENLYGPTEATVACTCQNITDFPLTTPGHETAAIGKPFAGSEIAIIDSNLNFQPDNTKGELAISGIQLATGYFNDTQMTNTRFPIIDGKRWYLTGDFAVCDSSGIFHHLGRIDHQVKVLGYRIELEDIEAHLRTVSGSHLVAAVAWPVSQGAATGIVGFVCNPAVPPDSIRDLLKDKLPGYMVPGIIYAIPEIPLTANGKIDRKTLIALLDNKS